MNKHTHNLLSILYVDHNNVIDIVFLIVPIVLVKPMIGATPCIYQMVTLLSSPRFDLIGHLNNFEPVIPRGIDIVAQMHTFVDAHPTFHIVWLQSFQHRVEHKHPIVQRHHRRLNGTDGLVPASG